VSREAHAPFCERLEVKFLRPTHLLPVLEKAFRRTQRPVEKSWRMDETYIRVKGEWRYLYAPSTVTVTPSGYLSVRTRIYADKLQPVFL